MQKGAKSAAVAVGRAEGPPPLQTPIACVAKHEKEGQKEGGRSSNDKGNTQFLEKSRGPHLFMYFVSELEKNMIVIDC